MGNPNNFILSFYSGFRPLFVLADPKNPEKAKPVEKSFPNFKQISQESVNIINNCVLIFDIPSQSQRVINSLKEFNEKVFVTIYRETGM